MISSRIMKHLRSYIKHSTQYFIRLPGASKSFLTEQNRTEQNTLFIHGCLIRHNDRFQWSVVSSGIMIASFSTHLRKYRVKLCVSCLILYCYCKLGWSPYWVFWLLKQPNTHEIPTSLVHLWRQWYCVFHGELFCVYLKVNTLTRPLHLKRNQL